MTATIEDPPTTPAEQITTLTPAQVAQHPDNLRDASRDLDALAKSIAEVGVIVPLIVVPVDQVPGEWPGTVTHVAVDGNRRQAAAAMIGADLPCLIRPDTAEAKATARTMAVTGLMRDGLTVTEEARAVQTMIDLGISQTAISKATGRSRDYVRAAKTAAAVSPETAEQAESYALTLQQLADLAEFDGDEQVTESLMALAYDPGEWTHAVTRARQDRDRAEKVAAKVAEFEAAGVSVVERIDRRNQVGALADGDGEPITDHTGCPGHQVAVRAGYWDEDVTVTEGCADPAAHGHTNRYSGTASFGPADRADETPEQAEARKAERRELIRLNKVADAAQEVRRTWLHEQLATKSKADQKKMTGWALTQILSRDPHVTGWLNDRSKVSVPPLDQITGSDDPITAAVQAPATRHPIMLWAYVVAAHEAYYLRDAHRLDHTTELAAYLRHLVDLGYPPAETDRLVMGEQHLPTDTATANTGETGETDAD